MKKSVIKMLSVILCVCMTVSTVCIFPIVTSAEDLITFRADDVTFTEGAKNFSVNIEMSSNPGIAGATVLLYFDPSLVEFADTDFTGTLFSEDDSTGFGNLKAANNRTYKSTVQAAGLEASADYSVISADLCCPLDSDGNYLSAVSGDGLALSALFSPLDIAPGSEFSIYIIVDSVYDTSDADIDFNSLSEVKISCESDPYIGKYEDFTIFGVTEDDIVDPGDTVKIDVRIDAAPKLWAARVFVLYPEDWSMISHTNGVIFPDDMYKTTEVDLSPVDRPMNALRTAASAYGITDLTGYFYVPLYWQMRGAYEYVEKNGLLVTLEFKVPEDAEPATKTDIVFVTNPDIDIIWTDPAESDSSADDITVGYTPEFIGATFTIAGEAICHHENTDVTVVPATCTENGYKKVVCHDCGEVLLDEVYTKTGHTEVETTIAATCKASGYYKKYCSVCNEVFEYEEYPALGHTEGTPVIVPATCTENGLESIYCAVCEELITTRVIEMSGHTPDEPVVIPATCTEEGLSTVYCRDCGGLLSSEVLPATGHTKAAPVTVPATCTGNGVTRVLCRDCGVLLSERLDEASIGHNFTESISSATSTVCGFTKYTCTRCSEVYYKNITAPTSASAIYAECKYTHVEGEVGTLNAKIYMAHNPGVNTLVLDFAYNKDVLKAVSAENGTVFCDANGGTLFPANTDNAPLVLYFEDGGISNNTSNGLLAEINFEVVGDLGEFGLGLSVDSKNTFAATGIGVGTVDVNFANILVGTDAVAPHIFADDPVLTPATATSLAQITRICTICGKTVCENVGTVVEEDEILLGDLNGDGDITSIDANLMKKAIAGSITLDETQSKAADLNGDSDVTSIDANLMTKYIAGAITEF